MRITILLLFCIITFTSIGQSEQKLFVGVNLGTKFGNKNYALRYSGGYNDELNQRIIQPEMYNRIRLTLNDADFILPFDSYPQNVRYTPQLLTGVQVGYNIGPNLQINLEANVAKMRIQDVFTIQVLDPSSTVSQEQYQIGNIFGEESRFTGRFNMDYVIESSPINYLVGFSGVFSAWRMDDHFAEFNNVLIPLFSPFSINNNLGNAVSDVGFGLGMNFGIEYKVNEKITCQLMYQPYGARLDYGYTINKRLLLEHDIVARFLWK